MKNKIKMLKVAVNNSPIIGNKKLVETTDYSDPKYPNAKVYKTFINEDLWLYIIDLGDNTFKVVTYSTRICLKRGELFTGKIPDRWNLDWLIEFFNYHFEDGEGVK